MKRVLVFVAVLCLLAGQAWADMTLTLNKAQAMSLGELTVSGGSGGLWMITDDPLAYEADTMLGKVGYAGPLQKGASITVGATAGDLELTGSYTGFSLFLANDNDDPWQATLYIEGQASPAFVSLDPGTGSTFVWSFSEPVTLAEDTDIGFIVQSSASRSDVFHMSAVVPAPVAVVLGMLGLGVAGLKLRKFV
jgi:hypothetical protein